TQKDFYRFYAFFHNIPEKGLDGQKGNAEPYIKAPSPEQSEQLAAYDRKIPELEGAVKARLAAAAPAEPAWETAAATRLESSPALTSGLLAHFALDEASGAEVLDAAGKLPNGRVSGAAARAEGRFGRALSFDGSSSVDLGPAFSFDRTDRFSYGAWIYPTS